MSRTATRLEKLEAALRPKQKPIALVIPDDRPDDEVRAEIEAYQREGRPVVLIELVSPPERE